MAETSSKVSNEHTVFECIVCVVLSGCYYQTYHYVR